MIKFKGVLSTTNVIILIIMASGNLIFGALQNLQEWWKMECVRQAIYHKSTEDNFVNCLSHTGSFDTNAVTWVILQFALIVGSILIAYWIETRKNNQK